MMFLRDHPLLNLLRRLRGWSLGDVRVMVEAKEAHQHYFCVFECRAETPEDAEALVRAALSEEGGTFVEVAQEKPATIPMPRHVDIVALSDRIYFGDTGAPPSVPSQQEVKPR